MIFLAISNEDDYDLIERLYLRHRNLLRQQAYEILRDSALAENAVHDTFVRVIHHIDKLHDENCPKTRGYLVVICRNVSKTMYVKQKRMTLSADELYDEDYAPNGAGRNPIDAVIDMDSCARIAEAIYALPPIYRDVILLKHAYKHSNAEICAILDILPETFNKRQYRARHMLRESLAKEGMK